MAIQLPNPGLGDGQTGDNEFVMWTKVKDNFSNTTHAASRLVGESKDNVMQVGAFGLGGQLQDNVTSAEHFNNKAVTQRGSLRGYYDAARVVMPYTINTSLMLAYSGDWATQVVFSPDSKNSAPKYRNFFSGTTWTAWADFWTTANATKDGNGFLKGASPVVDLYDDHIDLNLDAETQGVEFIKNGTGDYMLKTKTGLRSDNTWQIEIPQDNNKNPLFAVDIDAKEDGAINIKCYKRIFSMETFLFGPDFNVPMDITEGRFISVRLNDNPEPEQLDEPIE